MIVLLYKFNFVNIPQSLFHSGENLIPLRCPLCFSVHCVFSKCSIEFSPLLLMIPWDKQKGKIIWRKYTLYSRVKYLHGIPWKSMEIYGNPWNSMEIHGNPWNSMELLWSIHGLSMEFHGMPWSSTEFHEVLMEFHGMPWNSMEFPWRSMEFQGIL